MKKGILILILAICCSIMFGCVSPSDGKGGNGYDPIETGENELPVVPID